MRFVIATLASRHAAIYVAVLVSSDFVSVRPPRSDAESAPLPTTRERARRAAPIVLFTAAIFLNAALLFAVEPMFSKMVLPMLGGTPSVWNTCMLFFQASLLAGYGYAWALSRWLPTTRQLAVHLALLAVAALTLPIGIASGWTPPSGGTPIPWLIGLLAMSIGAPFLLLGAGAPLLQRWFTETRHPSAADPYFLYAASNVGSLLALLSYPVIVEPHLRLSEQSVVWSVCYAALIVTVGACAWMVVRRSASAVVVAPAPRARVFDEDATPMVEPTARTRVHWVLLSAVPSSLLLGVTTYLTTDIAPVPLLWVVPLAIYLLTFVLVFAKHPPIPHEMMVGMQAFAVLGLTIVFALGSQKHVTTLAPIHLIAFFTTAMVCHGELVRRKPPVAHLTEFYVWMSVGGLLGGVFNVLVAPNIFDSVLEYPIALVAACFLRPGFFARPDWRERVLDVGLPFALAVVIYQVTKLGLPPKLGANGHTYVCAAYALAALVFVKRPLRFGLGVSAILLGITVARGPDRTELYAARSFFGVYRVRAYPNYHSFQHGTTTHGGQNTVPSMRREPVTYYHRAGPLGQMFATLMPDVAQRRVAIVGLGTGTIACYARPGERWTYYEIDTTVVRIAMNPAYFTYLSDCAPNTRIVMGDARLSLVHAPDHGYDFIVLDAFSSDAIPAHLITREALALYLRKLAPGGAVTFHISNRYLKLEPVLSELARDARLTGAFGADTNLTTAQKTFNISTSDWVVLAPRATDLATLMRLPGWRPLEPQAHIRVWTDDFSDILSVFAW